MDNLSRFLSEIAWGLDEQAGALTDDGPGAIGPAIVALRDYAGQLRAVAEAAGPEGVVMWSMVEDEVGVDLEPESPPLIRIVFGARDVEALARDSHVDPRTATSRAVGWAPAIERTATELCSSQLRSVVRTDNP
jgi:hypothetical protein